MKRRGTLADIDQFAAAFSATRPKKLRLRIRSIASSSNVPGTPWNRRAIPLSHDGRVGVFAGCGHNSYQEHVLSAAADAAANYQTAISNEAHGMPTHSPLQAQPDRTERLPSTRLARRDWWRCTWPARACSRTNVIWPSPALSRFPRSRTKAICIRKAWSCRRTDAAAHSTPGRRYRARQRRGDHRAEATADAQAAGDRIYAVMLGSAINNDGARRWAIPRRAYRGRHGSSSMRRHAPASPAASLGYVEAHGTGTPLGDPIEVAALAQAFRHSTDQKDFVPSARSNQPRSPRYRGRHGRDHQDRAGLQAGSSHRACILKNPIRIDFTDSPFT